MCVARGPLVGMTDDPSARRAGITAMVGGGAIMYVGTALATALFGVLGPAGVTLARQIVMALAHGGLALRHPVRPTRHQVLLAMLFGAALATMNLTFYMAVARIGLGLAVTLEFVGPIAVAVLGFRTRLAAVCTAITALGVIGLARPTATTDWLGITFALLAAASWAGYIYANKAVGASLPGFTGSAIGAVTSIVLIAPLALPFVDWSGVTLQVIGLAALVGLLASAIPYACDLYSLRRLDAPLYASLLGLYPVLACLIGVVMLGEQFGLIELASIVAIIGAGAVVVRASAARNRA